VGQASPACHRSIRKGSRKTGQMLFSSVVFLFFFLPVVLTLYFMPSHRWRNFFFLFASLIFYAWGEGAGIMVLLVSIICNYFLGLWLRFSGRPPYIGKSGMSSAKIALICGICFNVGLLALFKYADFSVANLNALLSLSGVETVSTARFYAPLGISFFTFHAISYLVDIYRGEADARNSPADVALYMAAFPKILAGPIARYGESASEIDCRSVSSSSFLEGLERFITGLAKKVLIANPLSTVADAAFGAPPAALDPLSAWAGIICYTLQIYFDFSGYSDMAIGLGKMLGFNYPENFNFPYISQSAGEFWRRWHISLSTWFRVYLYIPLGGNRCRPARVYFNLIVVFLLCGLWHGASWNFIVWGGWYGLFLVLERTRIGNFISCAWRPFRHFYLLLVVVIGWVFFRAESLTLAAGYLAAMFGLQGGIGGAKYLAVAINNEIFALIPLAITLCLPVSGPLRALVFSEHPRMRYASGLSIIYAGLVSLMFVVSCMSIAGVTQKSFIYFKF